VVKNVWNKFYSQSRAKTCQGFLGKNDSQVLNLLILLKNYKDGIYRKLLSAIVTIGGLRLGIAMILRIASSLRMKIIS